MEQQEKITQPIKGTWNNLPTTDVERDPKVSFEVNIPVVVEFKEDQPVEMPSEFSDGVYYIFKVKSNGQDMVISTSAWTLMRALKILSPLKGKKIQITKKLMKGKQTFEVKQI